MTSSLALCWSALVSLGIDGCSVATYRTFTHSIGWLSRQRATSLGASGAGCRSTLHTRNTSGRRNAGSGWIDGSRGRRLSPRPLSCGVSSPSIDQCWNVLRCSHTLVSCWRRTTMMRRPSSSRCRRAQGVWAQVGQVLHGENVMPWVAAKFYKAVVQAILLYGSKMWNLSASTLARQE
jgi:hypothetical protein